MSAVTPNSPPRHLWIVGGIALVWSLLGSVDFTLLATRNDWYVSKFTAQQIAFLDAFPAWVMVLKGLAVLGGILGSALLLLRRRLAVPTLAATLLAMFVIAARNLSVEGIAGFDVGVAAFFAIVAGLVVYARRLARAAVLR